jgi:hypothetical protein
LRTIVASDQLNATKIGNIEYNENKSVVGCIIIITPINPIMIADHLYNPILSPKKIIDKIAIKNGAEKVKVDAVAKFIFFMAIK